MTVKLSVYLHEAVGEELENRIRNLILAFDGVNVVVTKTVDMQSDPDFVKFGKQPAPVQPTMVPRDYEFVGYAVGEEDETGRRLGRTVSALPVPDGFLVCVYEDVARTYHGIPMLPNEPGHRTVFFLPVQTIDDVRRAFFTGAD